MEDSRWYLGQTSEKYEVGNRGAGTIAHTKGDHGGASYGLSQFSVNTGSLQEYLRKSAYGEHFKGLTPATPAFDAKWKKIAEAYPDFGKDQHDYTKSKFFDVQVDALRARGLDLSQRGPAVQDAIWSTAVQFGGKTSLIEKGLHESYGKSFDLSKLSDVEIVNAIQDYKIKHNQELFRSSPRLWDSLESRARNEKADLLKLIEEQSIAREAKPIDGERDLSDARHPGNALYEQARSLMREIDARHGRTSDQRTDQAAGAIAVAAQRKDMTRIDQLDLTSTNGERIVIIQGTPGSVQSKVAVLSTMQALDTPMAQSSREYVEAMESHARQRHEPPEHRHVQGAEQMVRQPYQ